jgi:hypothetical protein
MKLGLKKKLSRKGTPEGQDETSAKKKKLPKKSGGVIPFYKKFLAVGHARFILLIGDEGTILIYLKGNTVLSRQFVPDASEGNLGELRETIQKDKQAPITMIIDSVDQSFVQQTLPPVSALSVKKLIKRRLERDFKPEDIKGAITLGREKGARKDWNFLMVSVERSPQLVLWLEFIQTFENRFYGIVLLSVESGIFIKNLERALGVPPKTGTGAEWKIIVSHNKVGGFRQIILRNGRLIFTRLALPVGEPTPPVIAGNIEQEMLSTIEYLKRFGYSSRSGLDVYIIASEDVCKLIDPVRFEAASYHAFSPHEVAQHLGIKGATQPSDQFGDVVLAAAVGAIHRNVLKLTTIESRLYDKYLMVKYSQRAAAGLLVFGMLIQAIYIGYSSIVAMGEADAAEKKQQQSQQMLDSLKKQVGESNINIDLVGNQIELYKEAKAQARSALPLFRLLGQALKPPATLKSVTVKSGDVFEKNKVVPALANFNVQQPPQTGQENVTVVLSLQFPAGLKSPALFKKFSEDYIKDMHAVMKDYTIAYTSVPPEYLAQKSLQMNFDQTPSENTLGKAPVAIEISIRGPLPVEAEGDKP